MLMLCLGLALMLARIDAKRRVGSDFGSGLIGPGRLPFDDGLGRRKIKSS